MSELLDERLREAFMELRDDVLADLQPPGPEAAHATVRRRRRAHAAIATAIVAVAAAGGLFALRPHGDPVDQPAAAPLDSGKMAALTRSVLGGLTPEIAAVMPGVWVRPVANGPLRHVFGGEGADAFPAGHYTLQARCAGQGSTTFEWQAPTAREYREGHFSLPCADRVMQYTGGIELAEPGQIRVSVLGGDGSVARAAFAVMLTDPRSVAAEAAVGHGDATTVTVTGDTSQADTTFGSAAVPPGRYRLSVVCVGLGTLRVSVAPVAEPVETELVCGPGGARTEVEATTTDAGMFEVTVSERTAHPGEAGYAYRVDALG